MLNFFESIISYIELIWEWFLNFIDSLLSLITAVAGAALVPVTVTPYMWGPIGSCILAVSGFAVVKMLVGRSNV